MDLQCNINRQNDLMVICSPDEFSRHVITSPDQHWIPQTELCPFCLFDFKGRKKPQNGQIIQFLTMPSSNLVLSKYEDRDLDFKYIVQAADLLGKVLPETIVNPTWSGGSDKGRSATILQRLKKK